MRLHRHTGTLQLDIVSATAPGNDNFASAVTVTPMPFTDTQKHDRCHDRDGRADSPRCGAGMGRTVWYNFTPSLPGTVTVNTTGSNFDTILAVYTGLTLATLLEVACNDDFGVRHDIPGAVHWAPLGRPTGYRPEASRAIRGI